MQGAQFLIKKLCVEPELQCLLKNMRNVADALIELAYYEVNRDKNASEHSIPSSLKIKKLGSVENVLVPTCNLSVRRNKDYSNIIGK